MHDTLSCTWWWTADDFNHIVWSDTAISRHGEALEFMKLSEFGVLVTFAQHLVACLSIKPADSCFLFGFVKLCYLLSKCSSWISKQKNSNQWRLRNFVWVNEKCYLYIINYSLFSLLFFQGLLVKSLPLTTPTSEDVPWTTQTQDVQKVNISSCSMS